MTHITVDQERMSTLSCVDLKIVLAISHVSSKIHLSAFCLMCHRSTRFFFSLNLVKYSFYCEGARSSMTKMLKLFHQGLLSYVVSSGLNF